MTEPFEDGVRPPGVGFSPDRYPWADDLKTAIKDIKTKRMEIDKNWKYYEGDHPPMWITKTLRDAFSENEELAYQMVENWCDVAVDEPLQRLRVDGFDSDETDVMSKAAQAIWDDNNLELDQKDLYRHMRIAGEGFAFIWELDEPDENKPSGFDVSINDPRDVYWPDDCNRTDPRFVAKVWLDKVDAVWRATLYYAVDVVRLVGPKEKDSQNAEGTKVLMPEYDAFDLDPDEPGGEHGFDNVPVVRFAPFRKRVSALKNLIPIQNRINKLVSQGMISGEYNAYRKLIFLTTQQIDEDDLKLRPNRALVLDPGGDPTSGAAPTSIWEGSPTDLSNYDNSIAKQVEKFFSKVPLPRHLLVQAGSVISGDAIEADEGPFIELIEDMQDFCGASWADLFRIIGMKVKPTWRNPAIKSDKAEMETVKIATADCKIPLPLALKKYAGWDSDELKELEEQEITPAEMANVMTSLSTGVALGGVDPASAKAVTDKMLGGKQNVATAAPKPPVAQGQAQPQVNINGS